MCVLFGVHNMLGDLNIEKSEGEEKKNENHQVLKRKIEWSKRY